MNILNYLLTVKMDTRVSSSKVSLGKFLLFSAKGRIAASKGDVTCVLRGCRSNCIDIGLCGRKFRRVHSLGICLKDSRKVSAPLVSLSRPLISSTSGCDFFLARALFGGSSGFRFMQYMTGCRRCGCATFRIIGRSGRILTAVGDPTSDCHSCPHVLG